MKKITSMVLTIGLGSALLLAGCGSNNSQVSDGINNMLDTTEQLSKAIDSGDQAKVKEVGPKLEKYLDPTIAGSEAKTLDKEALGDLNDNLTDALKELQSKTK